MRLKETREKRGLKVQQLARRCAELGAEELTASMIYNIESGRPDKDGKRRRHVTVDEWLILADALNIAPVHLLVPVEDVPYQAVPSITTSAKRARAWIRGDCPLEGTDIRIYESQVPEEEVDRRGWRPERVFYERTDEDGNVVESVLTTEGNREEVRMRQSEKWRRAPVPSEYRG